MIILIVIAIVISISSLSVANEDAIPGSGVFGCEANSVASISVSGACVHPFVSVCSVCTLFVAFVLDPLRKERAFGYAQLEN